MGQAKPTPEEIQAFIESLKPYAEYFAREIFRVVSLIPPPGIIIKNDGTMEVLPLSPEWQQKIELIMDARDKCFQFKAKEWEKKFGDPEEKYSNDHRFLRQYITLNK